ncbi:thiopurine S-methyltransferase [Marinicella meishanensis]|uniref:thiopurine S-methyltransferase n=1 Tax=Marinicella meishanensis TaxID=2873263 RepID=UPI001CBC8233|nr:thiopurine S-methyltransferase [Marinicella sp. NBU2979]
MQADFWYDKWSSNEIGFDQNQPNPLLVAQWPALNLQPGAKVFVPLCGKSIDMVWLLQQGFQVVGNELSEEAIQRFFQSLEIEPNITQVGDFTLYQTTMVRIYVGDFFALKDTHLGLVDATYDRASLVALPAEMRIDYAQHLQTITNRATQLLITFDYDQSQQAGPPFAIPAAEIETHYGSENQLKQLASMPVKGGLKGGCEALEQVWLVAAENSVVQKD